MTDLYKETMKYWEDKGDEEMIALEHKVWDNTPWMIDVNIGSIDVREEHSRMGEMDNWLVENIGKGAWPIHDKPGDWYRAGFTVDGWTWFGFHTQEQMEKFMERFKECVKDEEEGG